MAETFAEYLLKRHEDISTNDSAWNTLYQDVVDYVLPKRQTFYAERTAGAKVVEKIYDATAPWALDQLASGLHSFLTSQTQRWFKLALQEWDQDEIGEDEDVERWLEIVTNTLYRVFNSPKTNFAPQAHELYQDLAGFGMGVFFCEDDYENAPVRFSTFHLADCSFEENAYGVVDTVYRRIKTMTIRQAHQRFGDALPKKLSDDLEKNPSKKCNFLHVVKPRESFDPSRKTPDHLPFGSYWIDVESKTLIKESGFHEFPYMVPRWSKLAGETRGRGPAIMVMPDIKMVNAMSKTIIVAAQKIVDPPLMAPDEGFLLPLRTQPGGVNYFNSSMNPEMMIRPLETKGRVDIGEQLLESRRQHITRAFYLDWMQLRDGPQMTATETVQRTEDRMRLMAPSVSRLQSEFLDVLIERVYNVCKRKGLFPEPPQQIDQKSLRIEYVSPVAKAQKMSQVVGFQRLLESLGQIAQAKPEVFDRISADGTVDFLVEAYDASYRTLNSAKEVESIRASRAQAQQAAQESEQGQQDSASLLNVAKAANEGENSAQPSRSAPTER